MHLSLELIQGLAKQQGSAVLIVTHNNRILDMADRILRIEDGKLGTGYIEKLSLVLPTLTEKQATVIASKIELRTYQPSSIIIQQDELAHEFYILIEGMVEMVREGISFGKLVCLKVVTIWQPCEFLLILRLKSWSWIVKLF